MRAPNIFNIEILSPKQNIDDLEAGLRLFADKYKKALEAGHGICIPDNPMGNLCFQGTELITELGLPVKPGQISIHLNTFHSLDNLNWILSSAAQLGIDDILVVSGDGSQRLPKLQGQDLECQVASVTSVELVQYIKRQFPGCFKLGVAFNPYEPPGHEWEKMERKLEAGAEYITTQPIIGHHPAVERLFGLGIEVVVESWMSKRLHLLSDCVGYEISPETEYDPMANLQELMLNYPQCRYYLAILGYKTQFPYLANLLQEVATA